MKRRFGGFHKAEPLVFCCNFFDLSPLASGKKPESDGGSCILLGGGKLGFLELERKRLSCYAAVCAERKIGDLVLVFHREIFQNVSTSPSSSRTFLRSIILIDDTILLHG